MAGRIKDDLINEYRDFLHKIATSDTLLDVDGYSYMAEEIIDYLSVSRQINLKEANDMRTTLKVFASKTTSKILEETE